MRQYHFKCEACGTEETSPDPGAMVSLDLFVAPPDPAAILYPSDTDVRRADSIQALHGQSGALSAVLNICNACVPAFAKLMKFADRSINGLGRFVTHDASVDMSSGDVRAIPDGIQSTLMVTQVPGAFKPVSFEIENATDWTINNITIGNKAQFVRRGAIPAGMFAEHTICQFVDYERCQPNMELVVTATYLGKNTEGGAFRGKFHGKMLGFGPDFHRS